MTIFDSRLNNAQRKALEGQLRIIYKRKIDEANHVNEALKESIEQEVKNKLGFELVKQKIKQLDEQKELLEEQLKRTGFDCDGRLLIRYDPEIKQFVPVNSKANKLMAATLKSKNGSAEKLEKELDEKIMKLWLATKTEEAQLLVAVA